MVLREVLADFLESFFKEKELFLLISDLIRKEIAFLFVAFGLQLLVLHLHLEELVAFQGFQLIENDSFVLGGVEFVVISKKNP